MSHFRMFARVVTLCACQSQACGLSIAGRAPKFARRLTRALIDDQSLWHRRRPMFGHDTPRGDGSTYYFERKSSGFIIQQGPVVEEKAQLFTTGYIRYVQTYCANIG